MGGGCVYPHAMGWGVDRHPLDRHPTWADPPGQIPPRQTTPLGRHLPWTDTHFPKTATEAGSMHPTGMHSCSNIFSLSCSFRQKLCLVIVSALEILDPPLATQYVSHFHEDIFSVAHSVFSPDLNTLQNVCKSIFISTTVGKVLTLRETQLV